MMSTYGEYLLSRVRTSFKAAVWSPVTTPTVLGARKRAVSTHAEKVPHQRASSLMQEIFQRVLLARF